MMNDVANSRAKRAKIPLTQRSVAKAIQGHQAGQAERYWFQEPSGLSLRITTTGHASYVWHFRKRNGKSSDWTVGEAAEITPEEARDAVADARLRLRDQAIDPFEARQEARVEADRLEAVRLEAQMQSQNTFSALATAFMAAPEQKQRAERTQEDRQWFLDTYILPRIGDRPLADLSRRDIAKCIRDIHAVVQVNRGEPDCDTAGNRTANKAHAHLKKILAYALQEECIGVNVAAFPPIFEYNPIRRIGVLDDSKIQLLWTAFDEEAAKGWGKATLLAIKLCAVTLQRPNEIAQTRKEQFDWAARLWRIPANRTKTNVVYEVPLSDFAVELFKEAFKLSGCAWAFPNKASKGHLNSNVLTHRFGKTRTRLVEAKKLPSADVELYDFRRFGRTQLEQRLGFPEYIAERVINHATDRSMARRYDVGDHSPQIRRAHAAWAKELRRIIAGEPAPSNILTWKQAAE